MISNTCTYILNRATTTHNSKEQNSTKGLLLMEKYPSITVSMLFYNYFLNKTPHIAYSATACDISKHVAESEVNRKFRKVFPEIICPIQKLIMLVPNFSSIIQ